MRLNVPIFSCNLATIDFLGTEETATPSGRVGASLHIEAACTA